MKHLHILIYRVSSEISVIQKSVFSISWKEKF